MSFHVIAEAFGKGFTLGFVFGFCHFSVVVEWEFGVDAYCAFWCGYVCVGDFADFWKFFSNVDVFGW